MITIAFAAFCAAWFLINVVSWHLWPYLNRKPFNCEPCLSFWVGLLFGVFSPYPPLYVAFVAGFFGAVIAVFIKKAIY